MPWVNNYQSFYFHWRFSNLFNNKYLNLQFQFEEVDIKAKGNEEWFEKYRYEIPVFHFNGSFLMKHRVNEGLLDRELSKFEEQQRS